MYWIKCSAGELKDPGSIPRQGEFFFHLISFKEEMNRMVNKRKKKNNNNSSNSLVFAKRWQTVISASTKGNQIVGWHNQVIP